MATKAAVKRAPQHSQGWIAEASTIVRRVQSGISLGDEAFRAWKTFRERWQRLATGLRRESAAFSRDVQKELRRRVRDVRAQTQPWLQPLEKNAQRAIVALRKRTEELEKAARRGAHRILVDQLEVAPRKEVEQLRRRLSELEKQLSRLAKPRKEKALRAVPTNIPPAA